MKYCDKMMLETNERRLTLYPDELDTIYNEDSGMLVRIGERILHCLITGTDDVRKRRLTLRDVRSAVVLASILIFQGESYTIRTQTTGKPVLVSANKLPATLTNKVGWAFGFSTKNQMPLDRLQCTYRSMLSGSETVPPVYKVFCPWLHAAYQANENGNYQNTTVYWATNGTPTNTEALDLMQRMSQKCANEHNKSRINYVMSQIPSVA